MKYCKKFLACALVLCMVMSFMSVSAFAARMEEEEVVMTAPAAEEVVGKTSSERPSKAAELLEAAEAATDIKFQVDVSSKLSDDTVTTVTGTVDKDFNAKLVLPNADVSASNVTVKVSMNDVESLGGGNKSHSMTLNTGVNSQGNLFDALGTLELNALKEFTGATINAVIKANGEEKATTYTLVGETFSVDEGKVITATPDANVRDAWHLMVNEDNFDIGTQAADSKIVIANGSWLQIGTEKLRFEDNYTDDLVLDNIGEVEVLIQNIKNAVTLDTGLEESALSFCLKAGTTLAVSSSYAKLKQDVTVTVDGIDNIPNVLSGIRANVNNPENNGKSIIIDLLKLMNTAVGLVDGQTLTVTMQFGEPVEEAPAKFQVDVSSKLNDGTVTTVTGTVDKDFNAKLVLPNKSVNAGNVTVKVSMNDVESLGGGNKSHEMTLNTGVNSEGNLFDALGTLNLNALKNFNGSTINAVIKANGEEKATTYTLKGEAFSVDEGKIITATPDENVRAAWHHMVNDKNFDIGTQAADSYIVIANGSSLQIGTEKLRFEDGYEGDLKLDNIGEVEALIANIKAAVALDTGLENSALTFTLKKGTKLAVSSSYAELKQDVTVTVDGVDNIPNVLSDIRANVNDPTNNGKSIIIDLLGLMNTAIELVDGKTLNVTIEFACEHKWEESSDDAWLWHKNSMTDEWNAQVNLTCTECGETVTASSNDIVSKTTAPTCTEEGYTTYTATVVKDGQTFTNEFTPEAENVDALGHDWEVIFTRGANNTATYVATCQNDETHVEEGDATVTETTSGRTTTWTPSVTIDGETITGTSWSYTRPAPSRPTEDLEDNDPPLADKPWMFEDVEETDWFYDAVYYVYNNDIMDGISDTLFDPYTDTTRGMVAMVLYRMEGMPSIEAYTDVEIPDLADDAFYHDAAIWAYATGAYKGYDDGNFYGDKVVTRQELVTVLYRFAKEKGYDATETNDLATFIDNGDVAPWAREAMEWAVGAGLMKGRTETTVTPLEDTMRIELATILYRFEQKYTPEEKPEEK